jgi:hypothetical protein
VTLGGYEGSIKSSIWAADEDEARRRGSNHKTWLKCGERALIFSL